MAKASPGPGWETIQGKTTAIDSPISFICLREIEPQTSSAASSEDEIEDEETSREEVPQTLKRKSGPPPIAQKRLKVTPPDERTMSLPNPLTAQLVEKFPGADNKFISPTRLLINVLSSDTNFPGWTIDAPEFDSH